MGVAAEAGDGGEKGEKRDPIKKKKIQTFSRGFVTLHCMNLVQISHNHMRLVRERANPGE